MSSDKKHEEIYGREYNRFEKKELRGLGHTVRHDDPNLVKVATIHPELIDA